MNQGIDLFPSVSACLVSQKTHRVFTPSSVNCLFNGQQGFKARVPVGKILPSPEADFVPVQAGRVPVEEPIGRAFALERLGESLCCKPP